MPDIVLHAWEGTAGCRKVRAVLALKGLPHGFRPWTVRSVRDVLALDRTGEGPVLRYDGRLVVGAGPACAFLDDHHASPPLRPRDITAAALCHVIEGWADEALGLGVAALRWLVPANRARAAATLGGAVTPVPPAVGQAVASAVALARLRCRGVGVRDLPACETAFHSNLDEIDRLLHDRDHVLGPPHGRTLADIAIAVQLGLVEGTTYEESLRARPSLWRWFQAEHAAWGSRTDAPAG
ncbi:MAG: glutathione S-transferase C-terminal domain-containing protein [Myxococcota bacterium]|nr:glutathione S-transferase C-terminal domain-containing protein [Myxococcota bacterium]